MRFQDKVVIITGGASGIGLAIAKRMGSEGARIVLADINQDNLNSAAPEVKTAGAPDVLTCMCNVAQEDQVIATVQATLAKFGRLDVVVNNAGLMQFKALDELTGDDWLRVLSVDLLGHFTSPSRLF
nr:SDR family NAD(P)-dependent oxidoreductase [Hymenobacter sp. BRD67]